MNHDEHLERHLEICKSIFEKMKRDDSWPWLDSQNSGNLVESEDNTDKQ